MKMIKSTFSVFFLIFIFFKLGFSEQVEVHRFELVDRERDRKVPVKVYAKEGKDELPVIIFSHGLGGNRENNAYLGNYWAEANYVVVAVQHAGSDTDTLKNAKLIDKMKVLKEAVGPKNAVERFKDIPFVLDQLEIWNKDKKHAFYGAMNLEKIGMSGHSYGAITSLVLAGSQMAMGANFLDERLDAFLAMSAKPFKGVDPSKSFGKLKVPVFSMTGTKDVGTMVDPNLKASDREKVYEEMPKGDKYQLVLFEGEHHAFGDNKSFRTRNRNPKHHPAIQMASLHFWDAYLKGDSSSKSWLQSKDANLKSGLSSKDKWSWK